MAHCDICNPFLKDILTTTEYSGHELRCRQLSPEQKSKSYKDLEQALLEEADRWVVRLRGVKVPHENRWSQAENGETNEDRIDGA